MARAAATLRGVAHRTPVLRSTTLDRLVDAQVHAKAEHLQRVGAFKFRGAYTALAWLPADLRTRGVVAFSSGNHAQAVAAAGALLQVPVTVVMPADAPPVKLAATRGYGAEVVTYDRAVTDRAELAAEVAAERDATVLPPFDHPHVIAGQGTAAAELLADVAGIDLLVVPVGGGGLLAGSTLAAAATGRDVEVVGVEPLRRPAAREALAAGRPVTVAVPDTPLDGMRTDHLGTRPLQVLLAHDVQVVGVSDEAALATLGWVAQRMKQVLEPSGAAALAAVLDGTVDVAGRHVGVLLSGGNVAPRVLTSALAAR